jgi:hypothetical protein
MAKHNRVMLGDVESDHGCFRLRSVFFSPPERDAKIVGPRNPGGTRVKTDVRRNGWTYGGIESDISADWFEVGDRGRFVGLRLEGKCFVRGLSSFAWQSRSRGNSVSPQPLRQKTIFRATREIAVSSGGASRPDRLAGRLSVLSGGNSPWQSPGCWFAFGGLGQSGRGPTFLV